VSARTLRLGPGGEFDRLRAIFTRVGSAAGRDLGSDCAFVPVGGRTLAVSIDVSLEGVHFRTDWLSWREIGWRASAAALSDLAAAGATPLGVLVSLGLPDRGPARTTAAATELMGGVAAAVRSVGAQVLGGDLVRSARVLVDVCVLGLARRPVRRRGARAGDGVWVTGRLGGPALALAALRAGRRPAPALRRRFAHPVPRLGAGAWLARRGAHAMIDLSDGLVGDARHVAAASGVRLEIALERLPCWPGASPLAAAGSGEEYELLVTLPRRFGAAAARAFRRASGLPLTRIGSCSRGRGVVVTEHGQPIVPPGGFDQFPVR
jgi:thiamine-monophosphate kinase